MQHLLNLETAVRAAVPGCLAGFILVSAPAYSQDRSPPQGGWAGDDTGWYVEGRGGYGIPSESRAENAGSTSSIDLEDGFIGAGAVGHDFEGFLRTELELGYRPSSVKTVSGNAGSGDLDVVSYMANFIGEFERPGAAFTPFLGAGLGAVTVDASNVATVAGGTIDDSDTAFAFQGLAGGSFAVSDNLALTGTYSYLNAPELDFSTTAGTGVESDYESHAVLFGLRWIIPAEKERRQRPSGLVKTSPKPLPEAEQEPVPPPSVSQQGIQSAPALAPEPEPPLVREFIVFFDWDKADIRPDARAIIEDAHDYAEQGDIIEIVVTGHADRSGTSSYNNRLALQRASAVKATLIELGFPADGVITISRGEDDPIVQTADGVREPSNRRAVIVLQ